MDITIRQARYFVAAARAEQVSRAAVDLNVSQSAVTTAIRDLETNLGVRLLERRPKGVALTEAGSRFLPHAEELLSVMNEAFHLFSDGHKNIEGKVRLGVSYTVAGYFAIPLVARLRRRFPGVELELAEKSRKELEHALIEDELDIAILLTSNLEASARLDHITLVASNRRLWLPSGHEMAGLDSVPLSAIENEPYIMLTVDEAKDTQLRYWKEQNLSPRVLFETSSVEAVRTMVAAGMGVTVLSDMVYRPWSLEGQRIETTDIEGGVPSMTVGVCWKANSAADSASRAVIGHLERMFTTSAAN